MTECAERLALRMPKVVCSAVLVLFAPRCASMLDM